MHRDKKYHKKKGRKWTTSSKDARKEEEPTRRGRLRQEGESPLWNMLQKWKLPGPLSAGLWGRLVSHHTRWSEVVSFAQGWNTSKGGHVERTWAKTSFFVPRRCGGGPSCCPVTSSYWGFWGCPRAGSWQRDAETQKGRGFQERNWEVSERYRLICRRKHDVEGEDQLDDGSVHLAPSTAIFGRWTHNMLGIHAWLSVLWCYTTLEDTFHWCPLFFCPKALDSQHPSCWNSHHHGNSNISHQCSLTQAFLSYPDVQLLHSISGCHHCHSKTRWNVSPSPFLLFVATSRFTSSSCCVLVLFGALVPSALPCPFSFSSGILKVWLTSRRVLFRLAQEPCELFTDIDRPTTVTTR